MAYGLLCFFCLVVAAMCHSVAPNVSSRDAAWNPRFVLYLTGQHNVVPEPASVSRVTHVVLAFVRSDFFNVPGQDDWPLFTTVADVRQRFPDSTQVQIAIGGWGDTDGFSKAAKTVESRKLFAQNIKTMIDSTGADGVDIDWEYPGGNGEDYKQHPNSEKTWEIDAYPQLLSEIRAAIGPSKIISAAIPGLKRDMIAWTHSTVSNIMKSIDFVNIMTYDLMNRRDNATKHHSGVSDSWNTYTEYAKRGVLPWAMNLGFGFYVKWFKTSADLRCSIVPAIGCPTELMEDPVTGADLGKAGAFSWHDDVPQELAESFQRAMRYGVDDYQSSVGENGNDGFEGHYYMDQEERIFWTWDTAKAIAIKTTHFLDKSSVGGVFAWGLGEDAPRFEHLKAVNEVLEAMEKSEVPPSHGPSYWKSDEQRMSYAAQYLGPLLWEQLTLQGRPPICRSVNSDGLLNAGTQRRS